MKSNKRGLTLVELLVTIALLGLVMFIVSSIFLFNNKIFKKGSDQYDVQSNARIAMQDISKTVRYATDIKILENNPTDADISTLNDNDGYIFFDAASGLIKHATKNNTISFQIGTEIIPNGEISFASSSGSYNLGIEIKGLEENKNFAISSKVLCLNLKLKSTIISGIESGCAIYYKKALEIITPTGSPTTSPTTTTTPITSPTITETTSNIEVIVKVGGITKYTKTIANTLTLSLNKVVLGSFDSGIVTNLTSKPIDGNKRAELSMDAVERGFSVNFTLTYSNNIQETYKLILNGNSGNWNITKVN